MVSTTLGLAAASWALVTALSPRLQILEMVRRSSSEGISVGYFAVLLVGFTLWVAYGVARNDLPLIVPNSVAFTVMGLTIAVVLKQPQFRSARASYVPPPRSRHGGRARMTTRRTGVPQNRESARRRCPRRRRSR